MNSTSPNAEKNVHRMLNEWKRSMLTFWSLGLLMLRPMYGLEIKQEIENSTQGKIYLGVSTIYPLLRRLEKRGLVKSYWQQTTVGPPRAYYEPTEAGCEVVQRYLEEVLSPGGPIPTALGTLIFQIKNQLSKHDHATQLNALPKDMEFSDEDNSYHD